MIWSNPLAVHGLPGHPNVYDSGVELQICKVFNLLDQDVQVHKNGNAMSKSQLRLAGGVR